MLIIKIVNDGTGDRVIGNYRYQVMINDIVIESGEVKQHERRLGWQKLVSLLVIESNQHKSKSILRCEPREWSGE